jgi:hypothetical protein
MAPKYSSENDTAQLNVQFNSLQLVGWELIPDETGIKKTFEFGHRTKTHVRTSTKDVVPHANARQGFVESVCLYSWIKNHHALIKFVSTTPRPPYSR